MLCLSRRTDERIIMTVPPSDAPTIIEVVVCEIRKGKTGQYARLGITAPREVAVHRSEVQAMVDAGVSKPMSKPDPVRTWKHGEQE